MAHVSYGSSFCARDVLLAPASPTGIWYIIEKGTAH